MNAPALGPSMTDVNRVAELARTTPTPFYLYDVGVFAARAAQLRQSLPGGHLYYSAKANPHPRLIAAAAAMGCGIELASLGEVAAAGAAGVAPTNTILVGPAKTDPLLAMAADRGISAVVVESENELRRLISLADERGVEVAVMLRLNVGGARGSLRMAGHQFGMAVADAIACHRLIEESDAVRCVGYHGYLASQLLHPDDVAHNCRIVLAAVDEAQAHGCTATDVDLGGGFGIGYTAGESDLDLDATAEVLADVQRGVGAGRRLMFESGRFIAGPSGALVCRVVDVKETGGRRFVLLDGGMNTSGLFSAANGVRGLRHSVVRDGVIIGGGPPAHICGPLCTPMDRLATSVPCAARPGDLIVWWHMGAYGVTAAPINFLSFPSTTEVVIGEVGDRLA